jgi:hypothetical protein
LFINIIIGCLPYCVLASGELFDFFRLQFSNLSLPLPPHLVIVSCAGNNPKGNPVRLSLTNYSGAVPAAVNPIKRI